jgi:hypothetical protein
MEARRTPMVHSAVMAKNLRDVWVATCVTLIGRRFLVPFALGGAGCTPSTMSSRSDWVTSR